MCKIWPQSTLIFGFEIGCNSIFLVKNLANQLNSLAKKNAERIRPALSLIF
jgi:hypothetical protein